MNVPAAFKNFGHFIAVGASALVKIGKGASTAIKAVQGTELEVEAVTAALYPQAVIIEKGAYGALGVLGMLMDDAGTAFNANGLDAALDSKVKADVIAAIQAFKNVHAK